MRNTLYKSKLMGPLRYFTIKSVWDMVLMKLLFVSLRSLSTPNNKQTLMAEMEQMVSSKLVRRCQALLITILNNVSRGHHSLQR